MNDGADNRVEFSCRNVGGLTEFRLRYVPVEGVAIDVGRCPFFPSAANTDNTGRIFRKPNIASMDDPSKACISRTFHRSVEPDLNTTCCDLCSPTDIDWVTYSYDTLTGDLVLKHWQSPDGPGAGPSGPNDTLVLQSLNVPIGNFPANVSQCPPGPDAFAGSPALRASRYLDPCDVDMDGGCDGDDLVAIGDAFGLCATGGAFNEPADADHDGCIDRADLELTFDDCSLIIEAQPQTTIHLVSHDDIESGVPTSPEVVTGTLSELLAGGDFGNATCLGTFATNPAVDTLPTPGPGSGRYYLASGQSGCANFGDSSLSPDPRDFLDGASVCP
ncbi:MAG: hypothetical protein GY716_07210 [bacterium]|nr:hypothetical protein [bacterium]